MGLKVLRALDTATTQIYHFKAIIIAGMGLFTDAYDLFCIPPIMKLLGRIYYHDNDSNPDPRTEQVPPLVVTIMLSVSLLGTACGQIVFGRLGDLIGRRRVYGIALALMIASSIGCGFSICRTRGCVLASLGFFRFALGFGIGGDYPLSATIMSEFANRKTRGAFIAAVFSMQGLGILASSVVTMTVCAAFNHHHKGNDDHSPPVAADLAWRLILMLGALPAALTFYWRMMMPETARFTALVEQNVLQATKDMEKVLDVCINDIPDEPEPEPKPEPIPFSSNPNYPLFSKQFLTRHGRHLFACSATWFLLDIVFYSSNLFQSKIYSSYLTDPKSNSKSVNAYDEAYHVARLQAIIAVASTIPGYWATVLLIDRIGRVKIQILGFVAMAIGLFAIGIPYNIYWTHHLGVGFMFLYGLTFFFSNFGPNTTTFIVPAELFPARFRATCHGISGAAGKIGAMLGAIAFLWGSRTKEDEEKDKHHAKGIGMMGSLMILAGVSLLGAVVTFFFTPETMGRSLEENEIENETEIEDNASIQP